MFKNINFTKVYKYLTHLEYGSWEEQYREIKKKRKSKVSEQMIVKLRLHEIILYSRP